MSTTVTLQEPADAPAGEPLPRIPGYAVVRQLGRGGMGCVYLARDLHMGREVAIKTLFAGAEPEIAARFREEVAAVAAIRHPNVLQVYSAGDAEGRPYLVMEYVAGGTLGQALGGKPLPPREAARLIATIARAVQHCHEHGILHRDLKPGNILLHRPEPRIPGPQSQTIVAKETEDGATIAADWSLGTAKVADFGLAKRLHEGPSLTKTGDVLGTPAYMAPEQASGVVVQIGPGADIYSLGTILYELLTGRPPFTSPDPVQTIMMVLSMDPIPPRHLQPKLPRDLDTICLKCLEKTPRKRYATAAELADDLDRFVEGRPIHARPIRPWEKLIKWAKRRPAWAALGVVSVLAVAALLVAFALVRKKNSELNETNIALQDAQQKRAATIIIALEAVNRMLIELSDDLANVPQAMDARRRVLADAEKLCRAVIRENPSDPLGREFVAQAQHYLGSVLAMQGQVKEAEVEYRRALDGYSSLSREFPDYASYHQELLATWNQLGQLLDGQKQSQAAMSAFASALAEADHVPNDREAMRMRGRVRNNLAIAYARAGDITRAEAEHRRNLIERQQVFEQNSNDAEAIADLAATRINLGSALSRHEQWSAAMEEMLAAEKLYARLKTPRAAERASLGRAQLNIGSIAGRLKKLDAEGKGYAAAAATFSKLAAEFASVPDYRFMTAYAKMQLGRLHMMAGRDGPATEQLRAARDILIALDREFPNHPEYQQELTRCRKALGEKAPER